MTLLFCDGFEGYGKEDAGTFWSSGSSIGSGATIDQSGRRGGYCINSPDWVNNSKIDLIWSNPNPYNDQILTIGFAFKHNNTGNPANIVETHEIASDYKPFYLSLDADTERIYFNRMAGNTGSTMFITDVIERNSWYYFEIQGKIGATDGFVKLRINEQLVYEAYNIDTLPYQGSGNNQFSKVTFTTSIYGRFYYDDIYILDGSGTTNNDFLGDIRVDAIHPNGAGNYTQLTPSVGSNYECVDETNMDDSDYVEGANAGDKDSYTYENVPTDIDDAAIFGVQLRNQAVRTAESDNIKIKGLLRTGSTDYKETTGQSLGESFLSKRMIWEDDPSDSNIWTQAKINACEFGMEVA